MASRRKQGPVALRPQLSLSLPLSGVTKLGALTEELRQFVELRKSQSI